MRKVNNILLDVFKPKLLLQQTRTEIYQTKYNEDKNHFVILLYKYEQNLWVVGVFPGEVVLGGGVGMVGSKHPGILHCKVNNNFGPMAS